MDRPAPSLLKATAIGGAAAGVASNIPFLGALNCLCCSLLIGGGVLAAYLHSKESRMAGVGFDVGRGAMVGAVTGVIYAVVSAVLGALRTVIFGNAVEKIVRQMESMGNDVPPEAMKWLDMIASAGPMAALFWGLGLGLLLGLIFCTIGGLIGGAAFKFEPPAPAQPTGGTMPPPPPPIAGS